MRASRASGRPYFLLTLVYICVHLTHIALSCVLLLNGWTPMTVRQRAELADISVMGVVLNTWEGMDTTQEDDTYIAEFRLLRVYKGHDFLRNVTSAVSAENAVYNISNFGSKAQCYADVEPGSRYILFLTLYDGRLSGQYDDLFGAATSFSEESEQGILDYLGWNDWASWSPCNAPCDGGRQVRSRDCPKVNGACVGVGQESRSCNVFSCEGSHDLLTLMGVRFLPNGVMRSDTAEGEEYVITKDAKLSLPASRVYDVTLPSRFSILMELKVHKSKKRRYVFVVSDYERKQQLAVFIGKRIKFQYLGNNYGFKVDLVDNAWHAVSLSVDDKRVTLLVDCQTVFSRKLRTRDQYLGTNLLMSIGPYFPEYGKRFEGELRQLVVSDDTAVATQQCGGLMLTRENETSEFTIESMTTDIATPTTTSSSLPILTCSYAPLVCSLRVGVVCLDSL